MRTNLSFEQKSLYARERNRAIPDPEMALMPERYYAVRDIAEMLQLSDDKVRRMFQREADVLVIGDSSTRYKRRYTTLRIPASVLTRVLRRMTNA